MAKQSERKAMLEQPETDATKMEGILHLESKKAKKGSNPNRLYFVLENGVLSYYKGHKAAQRAKKTKRRFSLKKASNKNKMTLTAQVCEAQFTSGNIS